MRAVWNWVLRMRSDAYRAGERLGYAETSRRLPALKGQPQTVWLDVVRSICLQQVLREQQQAFAHFLDKGVGYPVFKKKARRQRSNYTSQGFSFDPATRTLKLAGIGVLKVGWSRKTIRRPWSVRLIRTASGRYFVALVGDVALVEYPKAGSAFGVALLATLSSGERVTSPRHRERHQRRLARPIAIARSGVSPASMSALPTAGPMPCTSSRPISSRDST